MMLMHLGQNLSDSFGDEIPASCTLVSVDIHSFGLRQVTHSYKTESTGIKQEAGKLAYATGYACSATLQYCISWLVSVWWLRLDARRTHKKKAQVLANLKHFGSCTHKLVTGSSCVERAVPRDVKHFCA